MATRTDLYRLRLPVALMAEAERLIALDGTSLDQFVATAVAARISAMSMEEVFAERKARADRDTFRRILDRKGGEPPRPGDELPPDLARLGRPE